MTLREYYQSLRRLERPVHPAKAFILTLSDVTGRSTKTVNQWLSGQQEPPKEVREKISRRLGISVSELFPQEVLDS